MASILLIEDNPSDETLALRALSKSPFVKGIDVVRDGQEALDYLLNHQTVCPRLMLLDLKLPRVNGLEVLRRVRREDKTKGCPVVVFTSSIEKVDVDGCFETGANSFVRKPIDFHEYMETLSKTAEYWLAINVACE